MKKTIPISAADFTKMRERCGLATEGPWAKVTLRSVTLYSVPTELKKAAAVETTKFSVPRRERTCLAAWTKSRLSRRGSRKPRTLYRKFTHTEPTSLTGIWSWP